MLFDGICVLCPGWVRFGAERGAAARFRFLPIWTC
jgi:predicted DCC family thiol-disulfide oxidoreductase YuxK